MDLFKLVETVGNEKAFAKVFESSYYNLRVVKNKESNHKTIRLALNEDILFVPKLYIENEDDGFEIEMQTTSYGSLDEKSFSDFIETQQKALEHVNEIKKIVETE